MKKHYIIAGMVLFMLALSVTQAQSSQEKMSLKGAVEQLFKSCKGNDYRGVAEKTVYTGNNQKRNFKAPLNPNSTNEKKKAKRISRKISALIMVADNYSIKSITKRSDSNADKYYVKVEFGSGKQSISTELVFIKSGGKFLLYEIN